MGEVCRFFDDKTGRCRRQIAVDNSGVVNKVRGLIDPGNLNMPLEDEHIDLLLAIDDASEETPSHGLPKRGGEPNKILCQDIEAVDGDLVPKVTDQRKCSGYWPRRRVIPYGASLQDAIDALVYVQDRRKVVAGLLDTNPGS